MRTRCVREPAGTGTWSTLAHANLMVVRKHAIGGDDLVACAAELLPLTVQDVRHLL